MWYPSSTTAWITSCRKVEHSPAFEKGVVWKNNALLCGPSRVQLLQRQASIYTFCLSNNTGAVFIYRWRARCSRKRTRPRSSVLATTITPRWPLTCVCWPSDPAPDRERLAPQGRDLEEQTTEAGLLHRGNAGLHRTGSVPAIRIYVDLRLVVAGRHNVRMFDRWASCDCHGNREFDELERRCSDFITFPFGRLKSLQYVAFPLELKRVSACTFLRRAYVLYLLNQGSPTFLSERHISCCTTVQRPDILPNVIVSGYMAFYQINKCFVKILLFRYLQKSLRPNGMAPRTVVSSPLIWNTRITKSWTHL